jgi:hypothetical protein
MDIYFNGAENVINCRLSAVRLTKSLIDSFFYHLLLKVCDLQYSTTSPQPRAGWPAGERKDDRSRAHQDGRRLYTARAPDGCVHRASGETCRQSLVTWKLGRKNLDEFAPPPLFQIFQRHYKFLKIQPDILSSFFVSSSQLPKSPWFIQGFKFLFEFAEIYEIFRYKSPPCYQRM